MSILQWLIRRVIVRRLAIDRICRLADIGERSLRFEAVSVYTIFDGEYQRTGKVFRVVFTYEDPRISFGNPNVYLGKKWEVHPFQDNSKVEEEVAEAIRAIKSRPAHVHERPMPK